MTDYRVPTQHVLDRARRGIEAVELDLALTGRTGWRVYALHPWPVHREAGVLYTVTTRTSVPLTRALAQALCHERVWVSGAWEASVLPVDFDSSGDPAEPVPAIEIHLLIHPSSGVQEGLVGTSSLVAVLDANDQGAWAILALEHRPEGWPM